MKMKIRKRNTISYKKVFITSLFLILTFMLIGFSAFSSRLFIKGNLSVATNSWNVHFANLSIIEGSVEAEIPAAISADGRKITASVSMSKKADFYEFEADIVNDGVMDAMVSEVRLSNIPESLKPFLVYSLTYKGGQSIKKNELLSVGKSERIKFSMMFNSEADLSKLPVEDELFDIEVEIFYTQATEEAIERGMVKAQLMGEEFTAYLDSVSSMYVENDSGIDFSNSSSETNGNGLYVYSGTEDDEYPIYYYRGKVDNNIIFAGFCWKIVRTTDTGGTKLLYNGVPESNRCTNSTGISTRLSTNVHFNNVDTDAKYVGYMYDTNTSSNVKSVIDSWYRSNLSSYSSYLEDTIWCNDRTSIVDGTKIYYGFYNRMTNKEKPIVTCPQLEDSFTVKATNGNGLLDYPIALITGDEAMLGGMSGRNVESYLFNYDEYWLLSPSYYGSYTTANYAHVSAIYSFGYIYNDFQVSGGSSGYGVRPSVSLASNVVVTKGNGTANNPYIVE